MTGEVSAGAGDEQAFAELSTQVREAMARLHVPGVAVGLRLAGREQVAGFGVTNANHPLPVTADTLFQVGSITKTVTGTAALRLVERGVLDLDASLRTYLPDLRLAAEEVAARVTLRHVFTHTGGWAGDYFADTGQGDDALAAVLPQMAALPQLTPLGELASYNNAGFYLAGRAIEVVTGRPFEVAVRELVLDPLGMTRSYFFPAEVIVDRVAAGHTVREEQPVVERDWSLARAANAMGGLISTVSDLLRYARFHMGDGTAAGGARLLTRESLALMQSPQVEGGSLSPAIGVTWMLQDVGIAHTVRHGGATHGQRATLVLVPARGFALAMLANADRADTLIREVTGWVLDRYLGLTGTEPPPLDLSAAHLAAYTGRYTSRMDDLLLGLSDGGLEMRIEPHGGFPRPGSPPPPAPPPMRVALCAGERLVVRDGLRRGVQGDFLRHPDGRIAWLRFGGRIHAPQG